MSKDIKIEDWKPYYGNLKESKFCDMGHGNKISNLQISNVNNSKGIEALIKEVLSLREEIKNIKKALKNEQEKR